MDLSKPSKFKVKKPQNCLTLNFELLPMNKVVVGVTGASGAIYAKVLFDKLAQLKEQAADVGVVMSDNARQVWSYELGNEDYKKIPFRLFDKNDFTAPFASGS